MLRADDGSEAASSSTAVGPLTAVGDAEHQAPGLGVLGVRAAPDRSSNQVPPPVRPEQVLACDDGLARAGAAGSDAVLCGDAKEVGSDVGWEPVHQAIPVQHWAKRQDKNRLGQAAAWGGKPAR